MVIARAVVPDNRQRIRFVESYPECRFSGTQAAVDVFNADEVRDTGLRIRRITQLTERTDREYCWPIQIPIQRRS
jgi:hypothetical protein